MERVKLCEANIFFVVVAIMTKLMSQSRTWPPAPSAVPKGRKELIKAHAEAHSESVNGFINRAIQEAIERDNAASGPSEGRTENKERAGE